MNENINQNINNFRKFRISSQEFLAIPSKNTHNFIKIHSDYTGKIYQLNKQKSNK